MAQRVLIAWELGGGFGHVARLRPFAEQLKADGHACAFAMRNLGVAEQLLDPSLGPLYQAPVRLGDPINPVRTQVSYASLLHNIGFSNPVELAGRLRAWRDLMRILRTELVIADHSPLALIAAQSLNLRTLAVGAGFTLPPVTSPFPSFRPRMKLSQDVLQRNEATVLEELNEAMKLARLPALDSLQQIFAHGRRCLLSYADLDHYDGQRDEPFLGHPPTAHGTAPTWPKGRGPRLFVHLRAGPQLNPLLLALCKSSCRVLIKADGIAAEALQPYLRPGLAVTNETLDFAAAAEQCDAWIGTGSHGLVCEMLLAGKPGLLLPRIHEQYLLARRVQLMGAGLNLADAGDTPIEALLDQLFEDDTLAATAQAFADEHRARDRHAIVPETLQPALN